MKTKKLFCLALSLCGAAHAAVSVPSVTAPPSKEKATAALANISVPFEENRGQADSQVAFQARTLAGPLFVVKAGELVLNSALSPSSTLSFLQVPDPFNGGW